jgi:hypothetical protein
MRSLFRMKTPRRNKMRSDRNRSQRRRLSLKANSGGEPAQKANDEAQFQDDALRAWLENAGVGGVEDLYAR